MLLGERAASKTAGWGSNPHARADCRRGSIEKGVRLVSGLMLVRIQSSALFALNEDALRVWRMHDCLRSSRARFDSSVGYFDSYLSLECGGCTQLCEG